jgi:hypothetical protein
MWKYRVFLAISHHILVKALSAMGLLLFLWLTADEIKEQITEEGPLFLINHIETNGL